MIKIFDDNELTYYDKQAILYFKLHFKTTDMIEDLKVFAGKQYGLDVDQVERYSIYNFVVKLYFKLINIGTIKVSYEDFVMNLFGYEKNIDHLGMIKKLRAEIQFIKAKDFELGEPDYTLLPKPDVPKTYGFMHTNGELDEINFTQEQVDKGELRAYIGDMKEDGYTFMGVLVNK